MRALVQRVRHASVSINQSLHSEIGRGLLIFLGVSNSDTPAEARTLAGRCASLRIFEDENARMNLSLKDTAGSALVVSQFTLYADTRRGNRPSFTSAAAPEMAEKLYQEFVDSLTTELGERNVRTGVFRTMMDINLTNDGPVTIMLESKDHAS